MFVEIYYYNKNNLLSIRNCCQRCVHAQEMILVWLICVHRALPKDWGINENSGSGMGGREDSFCFYFLGGEDFKTSS